MTKSNNQKKETNLDKFCPLITEKIRNNDERTQEYYFF